MPESHNFPLTSLTNQCVKCYGLDTSKTLDDDIAGNYFVIATVLPSKKVSFRQRFVQILL
jgi:hypothetical protein